MKRRWINYSNWQIFNAEAGMLFKLLICFACCGFLLSIGLDSLIGYLFNPENVESFQIALSNLTLNLFMLIYGLLQFQSIFLWEKVEKGKLVVDHYFKNLVYFQSQYLIVVSFILLAYFFTSMIYYIFGWCDFIEKITVLGKIPTYFSFVCSIYLFYNELKFQKALKNIESDF